ncbi:phosphate transport system regulatory protein PhoU [Oceanobacillus piezotolerans]|uniref:Phosphate-specific transport system accessory protein PhoU n=1 Tax=Oceanobacillus piezotolerans TaxID=2448030 RepID=A0A498DAQ9_9BACI|nr:phosphate signaling complex protein PhoU [Oceanobacillus piezotolerans]RLL48071.1 phosphate transport system regulatory protein PhoU [Oceanobacillus piezotolerans]
MATRGQFQSEIEGLNKQIVQLAIASKEALNNAMDSLFEQDLDKANSIIENDYEIDRGEIEINDKAILLIAKQQPVARDLRRIIIALRIVTDIERMADNAKNIANSTILLGKNYSSIPQDLRKMQEMILKMLQTAILAFQNEDIALAGKLAEMDDDVDKLYKTIVSELLGETATNPDKIQYVMQVAFTARYLERYADHITNIGESILYLVKGENYSLN